MPVVGFLTEVPEVLFGQPQLLAFRQGLSELGWVEGKKGRDRVPVRAGVTSKCE
jgi:hypothetical protein